MSSYINDSAADRERRQTPLEDRISSLTSNWIDNVQDYVDANETHCSLSSNGTHLDSSNQTPSRSKKREVYKFQADWLISTVAWSNNFDRSTFDLALTSYIEDYSNKVQLVRLEKDDYLEEITCLTTIEHPYPATKLLWMPDSSENRAFNSARLFATTADYLRIWRVNETKRSLPITDDHDCKHEEPNVEVNLECLLNANDGMRSCSPLTSFDWNEIDPKLIVTSSVDTTCTIWDVEVSKILTSTRGFSQMSNENTPYKLKSQILAHNHEVYDVSFSRIGSGRDIFVSSGGDGSIRLFDQRHLDTSSVLYEANSKLEKKSFVRVSCSKRDTYYVATFALNSDEVILLDIRQPGSPVTILRNHQGSINSVSWASHSGHHICTASDDEQAFIWELSKLPNSVDEPVLAYRAGGKINSISWSGSHSEWIAIAYHNQLELLRV